MRSDYVSEECLSHILAALMRENRLALLVSLTTGLRIDDVLHLKSEQVKKQRFTVKEMKTGKTRRVNLPIGLWEELNAISGRFFVFEHRTDPKRCRTRQAVYKDLKRACALFRVKGVNISPHSCRKIYAVKAYKRTCSVERVRELLNHDSGQVEVTLLYAMADELSAQKCKNASLPVV